MSLSPIKIPQTETEEPRTGMYCDTCRESSRPLGSMFPYAHKVDGVWHFPASGGGFYLCEPRTDLTNGWSCSCSAYQFRGRCYHLFGKEGDGWYKPGVYSLEAQGLTDDLPDKTRVRYQQLRLPEDISIDEL